MGTYNKGRPKKYDAISDAGNKPPKVAGEYRIKDKDNNLKYIGISNDIDRRVKEHKKTGKINDNDRYVEWMPAKQGASYDDIRKHERQKIKQKKPAINQRGGGAGPTPKKMNYAGGSFIPETPPSRTKKNGCYVATCVYGSYDCPQVWTLRRYRDSVLAQTVLGRLFIHTYYSVSPLAVRLFGTQTWFRKTFRIILDKMVEHLTKAGFDDAPYDDPIW